MLLIAMFACQTVASAFDAHQSHQEEGVHVSIDESHKGHEEHQAALPSMSDSATVTADLSIEQNNSKPSSAYDCHHCCHCHGSTPVYTLVKDAPVAPYHRDIKAARGNIHFSSIAISPEHRPPIA